MGYQSLPVNMTPELFERSIKASPKEAIKELIWNSCDADAKNIEISFEIDMPAAPRCARSTRLCQLLRLCLLSPLSVSSTLPRTNPLITSSFNCTIFSDTVCCLLSEWCVVASFYQRLQTMSLFIPFSICATYCTLSRKNRKACRLQFTDNNPLLAAELKYLSKFLGPLHFARLAFHISILRFLLHLTLSPHNS